jgi:hypothetical protein
MSLMEERRAAVEQALDRVRRIEAELGVSRAALEQIKPVLIGLAERSELFPPAHFPISSGGNGRVYRLAEDPDQRFALYASARTAPSPAAAGSAEPASSPCAAAMPVPFCPMISIPLR